jgi:hypothetical protein
MEGLNRGRIVRVDRTGQPTLIPLEGFVDGPKMLGFLGLDVEIERNEGAIVEDWVTELSLDHGADPIEEVRLKTRFVAVKDVCVGEHGA